MEQWKVIRRIVLIAISSVYLMYAFRIGFWITKDMHSGGPMVGVLLFPLSYPSLQWPSTGRSEEHAPFAP